jgi:hypothetical protein
MRSFELQEPGTRAAINGSPIFASGRCVILDGATAGTCGRRPGLHHAVLIIGELRISELLYRAGYPSRVVEFALFEFHDLFKDKRDQIARVEARSDAYHLRPGD